MIEAIIWSKEHCPYCIQAKNLLSAKGVTFEERNISTGDWSKEQLLDAVPNARTVPQIFIAGELIGGYDALVKYYNS